MLATAFSVTPPEVISGDIPAGELVMNAASSIPIPTATAVSSLPVSATLLLIPAAAVVAGPSSGDQYALIGAISAAIITLVAVRKYDQSLANGACAFIGALLTGVSLPGFLVHWAKWKGLIDDSTHAFITWHSWTLLGLVSGLAGWVAAQSIYQGFTKVIPGLVNRLGEWSEKFFTPKV